MLNALTVDLEEWFHVCRAERVAPESRWPSLPHRARPATERLLDLLGGTKATFFVLGYVAERDPALVRRVSEAGHEIASHGWGHVPLDRISPAAFRRDLRRSVDAIGSACGARPRGYRAPEWSLRAETSWAWEILEEEGFEFDSSTMPFFGMPSHPHRVGRLWEFPASTLRLWGREAPILNGTAVRLLPASILSRGVARLNSRGLPANVAFHPWELDRGIPRVRFPGLWGALHYWGVGTPASKLAHLLARHRFAPISRVLSLVPRFDHVRILPPRGSSSEEEQRSFKP